MSFKVLFLNVSWLYHFRIKGWNDSICPQNHIVSSVSRDSAILQKTLKTHFLTMPTFLNSCPLNASNVHSVTEHIEGMRTAKNMYTRREYHSANNYSQFRALHFYSITEFSHVALVLNAFTPISLPSCGPHLPAGWRNDRKPEKTTSNLITGRQRQPWRLQPKTYLVDSFPRRPVPLNTIRRGYL